MRVARLEPDLLDRFEIVVNPNAEPADWDEAVAEFLVSFVQRKLSTPTSASTVDQSKQDRGKAER